mgnify:CR=1 FL=1
MELTEQKHKVEWLNGSSNFSEGVQPRKEQLDMVEFCRDSIIAKKKKVMMIDAPTGCLTRNEKINIYILKDRNINEEETSKST